MPLLCNDGGALLSAMTHAKVDEWMEGRGARSQQTLSQSPEVRGHFSDSIFFGFVRMQIE
jgi:hypothetical protein